MCAFGVTSKKPLPDPQSRRFTPVFSPEFIVPALTFRPPTHVELGFAQGARCGTTSFFCIYPVAPSLFAEKPVFPPWSGLSTLVEIDFP